METGHSQDFTVVTLPAQQWAILREMITNALRWKAEGRVMGGWQRRLLKWNGRLMSGRSVLLAHVTEGQERQNDMTFVRNAIIQRDIGGWQGDATRIFKDTHERFTGLPTKPRPVKPTARDKLAAMISPEAPADGMVQPSRPPVLCRTVLG